MFNFPAMAIMEEDSVTHIPRKQSLYNSLVILITLFFNSAKWVFNFDGFDFV